MVWKVVQSRSCVTSCQGVMNNRRSPAGISDVRKGIESDFAGSGYDSSFQYFATRRGNIGEVATYSGMYVTISPFAVQIFLRSLRLAQFFLSSELAISMITLFFLSSTLLGLLLLCPQYNSRANTPDTRIVFQVFVKRLPSLCQYCIAC